MNGTEGDRSDEAQAYHDAGHLVLALLEFQKRVHTWSLGGGTGQASEQSRLVTPGSDRGMRFFWNLILYRLAGPIAETRYHDQLNHQQLGGCECAADDFTAGYDACIHLANMEAAERLLDARIRTPKRIEEDARVEAINLVEKHWERIREVATALVLQNELTEDELRAALRLR